MLTIRRAAERGRTRAGWLESYHTFTFGDYRDPAHMGFRSLRVINDDHIAPGAGFGMHPHRDMEIVTFVLDGALEHRDNLGHVQVLRPGEVQHMSAGTGIWHSEVNPSSTDGVHLYQIWIQPRERGLPPSYEQKAVADGPGLRRVVSPRNEEHAVRIEQDAAIYHGKLAAEERQAHALAAGRHAWVQVLRGSVDLNEQTLSAGDGAAASGERSLELAAISDAEVLIFDLS